MGIVTRVVKAMHKALITERTEQEDSSTDTRFRRNQLRTSSPKPRNHRGSLVFLLKLMKHLTI